MTQDTISEKEVIEAELARCRAISTDDYETAAGFHDDDLTYVHSIGHTDNKTQLMASFKQLKRSFEREELSVQVFGDVAMVIGDYIIILEPQERFPEGKRLVCSGLQVWVKREDGWKLLAHQGTPKPEPDASIDALIKPESR